MWEIVDNCTHARRWSLELAKKSFDAWSWNSEMFKFLLQSLDTNSMTESFYPTSLLSDDTE